MRAGRCRLDLSPHRWHGAAPATFGVGQVTIDGAQLARYDAAALVLLGVSAGEGLHYDVFTTVTVVKTLL